MTFLKELIFVYPFIIAIIALVIVFVTECEKMKIEEEKKSEITKAKDFKIEGLSRFEINEAVKSAFKADRERQRRLMIAEKRRRSGYHRPRNYDFF